MHDLNSDKVMFEELLNQAIELHQNGEIDHAEECYERALLIEPNQHQVIHYLGLIAAQKGDFDKAEQMISTSIELDASEGEKFKNRGLVKQHQNRYDEAFSDFQIAKGLMPDSKELDYNIGSALLAMHQYQHALEVFNSLVDGGYVNELVYNDRASALHECGQIEAAVASYDEAIRFNPMYAEAYYNKGLLAQSQKQHQLALSLFEKSIELNPNNLQAYNNMGTVLDALCDFESAIQSYGKAIALDPGYVEAYANMGNALASLRKSEAAIKYYDKAIELKKGLSEVYNSRANVLAELDRHSEALLDYDRSIQIKPEYADAHSNKGIALYEMRRHEEAIASYQDALKLKPDFEYLFGLRLHTKMIIANWDNYHNELDELSMRITAGDRASTPFPVLSLFDDPYIQRRTAEVYSGDKFAVSTLLGSLTSKNNNSKTKIGYFSADFRVHAVSILMAGVFEHHDKDKFELLGFAFGPSENDVMRTRVAASFDEFIDVSTMADVDIAKLARAKGVDIAVDLTGFTQHNRTQIFAHRAAPIQVNYLGYPGTMGASYYDYIIADKTVIPELDKEFYVEKVAYLPSCYQPNDMRREISNKQFSRKELGLPDDGFVFCSFNNNFKINPDIYRVWMGILVQVPDSVLWLLEDNPSALANLKNEAEKLGVQASRIIFAKRLPHDQHLARHRVADIFLDTLPYNAHTTASDALWAGLPVITRIGKSFQGRVAASLLKAIGMPELITQTDAEYATLAVELSKNPTKLNELKAKLNQNRSKEPLFDTRKTTLELEFLYKKMFEIYESQQPPRSIG